MRLRHTLGFWSRFWRGLVSERLSLRSNAKDFRKLAGSTGLEPAASGVTGRRSNQLNYDPKMCLNPAHRVQTSLQ